MYAEMIEADVAMFSAVSLYFAGVAQIHLTKRSDDERDAFRKAAPVFQRALEQLAIVNGCEERLLAIAKSIEYSAYYVRRHQVARRGTEDFRRGLELMVKDLSDGYYPLAAFSMLNPLMARLVAGWDLNARVEGVITRLERAQSKTT